MAIIARACAAAALTLCLAGPAAAQPHPGSVTAAGITIRSVSLKLPRGDRVLPPGPGQEVAQAQCTGCHSVGMVLYQPALPRATWEAEVRKMIGVYKAPVPEGDVATIVGYLDAIKGAR
jgi:mono/diheme cytochrome c family protein